MGMRMRRGDWATGRLGDATKTARFTILLLAVFFTSCNRKELRPAAAASDPPALAVEVLTVRAEPFAATVAVTGSLVSNARVDVKAEIIGRLVKFPKQEGERVEAGEAVASIDDENYRLAARQAESAVQVAQAGLERARVLESHSQSERERARNLIASGGITEKDLQAAEVAQRDARAQVALASAQLDQAQAALAVARKKLQDTVIRAPVSGEIQHRFINPGAYVEAPTPVFTVVDNQKLELESPVASVDLAPVRPGQRVTFAVNSYPGTSFEGRVVEVNPAVDADSRSAKVRIRVPNPGGKLKAGMFAQGEILTGLTGQAIVIPAGAVYRDDRSAKASSVFVIDNHRAARRPVRIGRERDTRLEITEGLQPGDLLIAEQRIELAEGVRVEPRK